MDAWSSKHIALTILGDKMLTCFLRYHMSIEELKALDLLPFDGLDGANDRDRQSNGL